VVVIYPGKLNDRVIVFINMPTTKDSRSIGASHSNVWSAASDNDEKFIQRWVSKVRSFRIGGTTRKRRGLEYGRTIIKGESTTSIQTRQYTNHNTGRSVSRSLAQRKLQSGPNFVVHGRPGDGGGIGGLPQNIAEPDVWTGWTCLMCASASGHVSIVKMLLGAGASPMFPSRDESKITAAHVAAQHGRFKILKLLMDVSPRVIKRRSSSSTESKTPFHMACETDRFKIVQWLLENDNSEDHGLVDIITEDDEYGYTKRVTDLLAEHRQIHKDRKFMIKANAMRAELGF
jgi:hypothetical protein